MNRQTLSLEHQIAQELHIQPSQVLATVRLLDDGATVPFIARYRKEATQQLTDQQLRHVAERLDYIRELHARRDVIISTLREQEKLTIELEQELMQASTKTRLEDLYLPYRTKRQTRAFLAKEAGLEPLAEQLLHHPQSLPEECALLFIRPEAEIHDVTTALEGAAHILMERWADDPDLLASFRDYMWQEGRVQSSALKGQSKNPQKYADYFKYEEAIKNIPSHRALALFRGRRERALQLRYVLPDQPEVIAQKIARHIHLENTASPWLMSTVQKTWTTKLAPKLETESFARLRELADNEAIRVFSGNLTDLLLASPAGPHVILGLDPGIRTGVKAAVVDATGHVLDDTTVFPLPPHNEWHASIATLAKLAAKHHVSLISIGNGTGSRETERLVTDLIKMYPDLKLTKVLVSEAGASVYSASELASQELPDLDVTLRGAVSIARRLQDPLAELVKIDPKAIGVGQYQHDVNQARLARSLEAVVEDCVNAVGVDVNVASAALLTRVAGLNTTLAQNIIAYRQAHGAFQNREQLKNIPRMGDKAFQQSAGFLRIACAENPLDASGVHPEAYPLVERILADQHVELSHLIGNRAALHAIPLDSYVDEEHGLPTLRDIIQELEKPGRDPRPEFKTVHFKEGVDDLTHLHEDMLLEGVVSNITDFGVFVDIGVHQDGLVHISALTDRFIRDPRQFVKVGDVVKVKVLSVDVPRRRISLTMKLNPSTKTLAEPKPVATEKKKAHARPVRTSRPAPTLAAKKEPIKKPVTLFNTSMADALSKIKQELDS